MTLAEELHPKKKLAPLRFLHIPKTAGATFTNLLRKIYTDSIHFGFIGEINSDRARYFAMSQEEQQCIQMYWGHAPLATGLPAVDQIPVITFLRDPIERVKSFCQFVAEGRCPYLQSDFPPETFDLDRFLDSGNHELSNLQTKMLIVGNIQTDALPPGPLGKQSALRALLKRVDAFGLVEFFDETLMYFMNRYAWPWPFYETTNAKDPTKLLRFEQRHIHRIAIMNGIDIAVYECARTKFLDLVSRDDRISQQVDWFRRARDNPELRKSPPVIQRSHPMVRWFRHLLRSA